MTTESVVHLLTGQIQDLQISVLRLIEENAKLRGMIVHHCLIDRHPANLRLSRELEEFDRQSPSGLKNGNGEPFVFKSRKPTLEEAHIMGMPVFERCQKTRFQDCDHCEWFECGDNQNPNKKVGDPSQAPPEEWGAQSTFVKFPVMEELPLPCCGHTPDQHGTEYQANKCGCMDCAAVSYGAGTTRGLGF